MLQVIVSSTKTSATHMTSSTFNALPKMLLSKNDSKNMKVTLNTMQLLQTKLCYDANCVVSTVTPH